MDIIEIANHVLTVGAVGTSVWALLSRKRTVAKASEEVQAASVQFVTDLQAEDKAARARLQYKIDNHIGSKGHAN